MLSAVQFSVCSKQAKLSSRMKPHLMTAESNEIGVFLFEDVPYGNWLIRELKPAPAFVLNENVYPVTVSENEETVEITVENRFITGAVQTHKGRCGISRQQIDRRCL